MVTAVAAGFEARATHRLSCYLFGKVIVSRSVHTSRAKLRKAFQFEYSKEDERQRVLGKIIDEAYLKRDLKENVKRKRQTKKAGLKSVGLISPLCAVASKKTPATSPSKKIAKPHDKGGYGRTRE